MLLYGHLTHSSIAIHHNQCFMTSSQIATYIATTHVHIHVIVMTWARVLCLICMPEAQGLHVITNMLHFWHF